MNYQIHKPIFTIILGVIIIIVFTYLVIFGRALKQNENHINIFLALPKIILTAESIKIDNKTYLASNVNSFIRTMEKQDFTYAEQMGSAYIFIKNGERYIAPSQMYSSYFIIFSSPIKISNSQ
jgi:ABC-type sulfate transport system permease subunit